MKKSERYRRKIDGSVFDAHQYGGTRSWSTDAITNLASFILGMDTDAQTSIINERLLDVVQPIKEEWGGGKFPVHIYSLTTGVKRRIEIGYWVVKMTDQTFVLVTPEAFEHDYEKVEEGLTPKETDLDILTTIIREAFGPIDGNVYQHIARAAAKKVIQAGWTRKELS